MAVALSGAACRAPVAWRLLMLPQLHLLLLLLLLVLLLLQPPLLLLLLLQV